jgi:hypothetical protein
MDNTNFGLKVLEVYTRDVGRRVGRIDYAVMDSLDLAPSDSIDTNGDVRTVVNCLPLDPTDEGKSDSESRRRLSHSSMSFARSLPVREGRKECHQKCSESIAHRN